MASRVPSIPDAPSIRDAVDQNSWRRKWLWVLALIAVAAVVALGYAPVWVARHLQEEGITLRDETGRAFLIRAEKVSLGWFSPARLSDVSIDDREGHPLLTAETIVSERPLSRLVLDRKRPGRFIVRQPKVDVRVRADGSNLEDFIAALLARDRDDSEMTELAISASDGRIEFHDPQGGLLASIEDIEIRGSHRLGTDRAFDFELTSVILQDGRRRPVEAAIAWRGPRQGLPMMSGTGTAAVKFAPFPLSLVQPHLARVLPDLTIHGGSLAGQLFVECDLTDAQKVTATGQLIARDLHAATEDDEGQIKEYQWAEEELAFHVDGQFDPQTDVITLSDATLQSTPVSISATGTVADVHGESLMDVRGDLKYDVTQLVQSFAADYVEHVRIEGLQTRAFGVHGPLAQIVDGRPRWDVSRLSIEADLGWETADVFGVRSEQATIVARLEKGVLSFDPRDVPVSGGRFVAAPRVRFPDAHPAMQIGPGPALENVELSPEMCRLWLKYLSPPMADATRIDGRFSISLEEGHIPLNNMAGGRLSGLLHVHTAAVRPGAFAEQMIGIVGRIQGVITGKPGPLLPANNSLIAMDDQRIPFVVQEGRVHHERLEFTVAGAVVQTSGSVGFDDSLDLLITIPVPESWLTNADLRNMLGGEVIQIPVRGTLDEPQFDLLSLTELARRLALKATGGFLQKLLD